MAKYPVVDNRESPDKVRNRKEKYRIVNRDVINILCEYGQYDPGIQETISAQLAIGKVKKVRRGKERIGTILHLKIMDITTLAQAISDSGFLPKIEMFRQQTAGLTGFIPAGEDDEVKDIPYLLQDSPRDQALQEFFSKKENRFWDLCMIYFSHMAEKDRKTYSFFISY